MARLARLVALWMRKKAVSGAASRTIVRARANAGLARGLAGIPVSAIMVMRSSVAGDE
jgi:hypothetical protein